MSFLITLCTIAVIAVSGVIAAHARPIRVRISERAAGGGKKAERKNAAFTRRTLMGCRLRPANKPAQSLEKHHRRDPTRPPGVSPCAAPRAVPAMRLNARNAFRPQHAATLRSPVNAQLQPKS